MKLRDQIIKLMQERDNVWTHKSVVMDYHFPHKNGGKYQADSISRMLCKMEEACLIAVYTERNGKTYYRWIPVDKRPLYLRKDERSSPTQFYKTQLV